MKTPSMISTPALVLTLGHSLYAAVAEVERIYLQSDPRRQATSCFMAFNFNARKPEVELIPVMQAQLAKAQDYGSWKQVYEQTLHAMDSLCSGIRSALHELRTHEKLIEMGLGDKTALPLDIFLIADLSEPESAALLPFACMIQSLLVDEPYGRCHLLLNVAVFESEPLANAHTFISLKHLNEFLHGGENDLAHQMGLQSSIVIPQVYLFDRYKEGIWEVRDAAELHTILGNFLLALLSGGLAQQLAHGVSQMDIAENQACYNSASATVLIFDVDQLSSVCALRLGAEILESEFHSRITPDPRLVDELAAGFQTDFANSQMWAEQLCHGTSFHVHSGGLGLELHFSDLKFEDIPMQDWTKTIREFDNVFQQKHFPYQKEIALKNRDILHDEFQDHLSRLALSLPQNPRLYPGGLRSSHQVMEQIKRRLAEKQEIPLDITTIEEAGNARLKSSLDSLDMLLSELRKHPRWFFRLPVFLRNLAVQIFNLVFLRRELQLILDLRQTSVKLLEQKYAAVMEELISQNLTDLCKGWVESVDKHLRSILRLQSALDRLCLRLKKESSELSSIPSLFRLSAVDDSVLAWAYYNGKRPQEGFRQALLSEHGFLDEWQKTNVKNLGSRLGSFCREIYQPLMNMDLEGALHHRDGKDANALTSALVQGAVPLLRPNFDQTGSGLSFQTRFFQCKDPRASSLFATLRSDMQEWQEVDTEDSRLAICCRVRSLIPFSALNHIFERGRADYETLDEDLKAELLA